MSLDLTFYAVRKTEVFETNITHNLAPMAEAAGIYGCLWKPEENNIAKAADMVPLLEVGLEKLKTDPKHFETFNSPNGWGMYKHFVPFVEGVLKACRENPDAEVEASR